MKPVMFIHIPKTAGISIYETLLPTCEMSFLMHCTSWQYRKHFGHEQWEAAFKFCFIRNPWEWLVSFYKYHNAEHKHITITNRPFDRWIMEVVGNVPKASRQHEHQLDQWQYFTDAEDNLMVDFIGRFENLQHDFKHVCKCIGIDNIELLHKNKSEHGHYSTYYNDETRDAVTRAFPKLISFGDYTFG